MHYEVLVQFLVAALWGGIVGAEREYRNKSAGFRTMIMISTGSCLFTMMSLMIGNSTNPDCIASNIVTGIGFLGAGVIFRSENRVSGITTAATIWCVAAVGMGIGAGYYYAAAWASLLILAVLAMLPYFEEMIDKMNQSKIYSIKMMYSYDAVNAVEAIMKQYRIKYKLVSQVKANDELTASWQTQGTAKNHQLFISLMQDDARIKRFEC